MKPVIADLFCGAGGAARGLQEAGFYVVGFDINAQPRYAGDEFHQAEALGVDLSSFDAVWASPPCQAYSLASLARRNQGHEYPDLVADTRAMLEGSGVPWIIENVPGAPLDAHVVLCGCQFGLRLRRVRWFETSWQHFQLMRPCLHEDVPLCVVGTGTPSPILKKLGYAPKIGEYRAAMGIDWMTRAELSQAIPPAYSRFLGEQLMQYTDITGFRPDSGQRSPVYAPLAMAGLSIDTRPWHAIR